MNLTELKQKPITELLEIANQMALENMGRSRKQDVIFGILKKHAKSGEDILDDGRRRAVEGRTAPVLAGCDA